MAGKRPRILCLDDQPINLGIRKTLLEQFGCDVVAVNNVRDCLAAATKESFDLALLDYHLGEQTNGEDVARDLRVCTPHMKLVMLTGDPNIPASVSKTVDAVLTKGSSNPEDLFATIQDLLPECTLKPRRPLRINLFPPT